MEIITSRLRNTVEIDTDNRNMYMIMYNAFDLANLVHEEFKSG